MHAKREREREAQVGGKRERVSFRNRRGYMRNFVKKESPRLPSRNNGGGGVVQTREKFRNLDELLQGGTNGIEVSALANETTT